MLPKVVSDVTINTIFLGTLAACIYAVYKAGRGQYAEIPTLSQAALIQCSDTM
jgi:phage tail protein X